MRRNFGFLIFCVALFLTGCGDLKQPAHQATGLDAERTQPARSAGQPTRPASLGTNLPAESPISTVVAGLPATQQARLPTGLPGENLPTPQATVQNVTRVASYDAAQMVKSFASEYLGLAVSVTRGGGLGGQVSLPETEGQNGMQAALAVAGQAASAAIQARGAQGIAEVAVGAGTISGDLQADLSGASAGTFALLVKTPGPSDATAALKLIQATFPALARVNLQAQSNQAGAYVFQAVTTHPGVDRKTHQAIMAAEAVLAGATHQGRSTLVWVVIGNGQFAANMGE